MSNYLVLDRPCPQPLHRQTEEDVRVAIEAWFPVLKALAAVDPDLGTVSGKDGRAISELDAPPESWVDWFMRDNLVVNFTKPVNEVFYAYDIRFVYGQPDGKPSRLRISGQRALMENAPRLLSLFEPALQIWDSSEGRITVSKSGARATWLYWLKDDKEPTGYARSPMPGGWSERRPLQDGMLYIWPENAPGTV